MSLTTYDSFTGAGPDCHFNVLSISRSRQRRAAYSNRHVPYGDYNIVQVGGRLAPERVFTLYVPSDGELDNLEACLGQQGGTLHYAEGDVTALLVEFDAGEYLAEGNQVVKATFITDTPTS